MNNSIVSERALLGAVLQAHDRAFPVCQQAGITSGSFTDETCIQAWCAMELLRSRKPGIIDPLTVAEKMPGDAGENLLALSEMVESCPTSEHAAYYAEQVRGAERRRTLHTAARLAVEALARGDALDDVAADLLAAGEAVEGGDHGQVIVESIADFLNDPPPPLDCIVEELFGAGEKGEIIAPSKARKSFFAIDLAVHIAAGRDWLGFKIPRPRRVLLFNLEISRDWMKRRFYRRLSAYGINPEEIRDTLSIVNARSRGQIVRTHAVGLVKRANAEVVIVDPRYKLLLPSESENTGEGVQGVLDLQDRIAEAGAAAIFVGHDAKGTAGDRDDRDRGAGSGWTGRDCDFRLVLSPHADDPQDAVVLSIVRRNFPPFEPVSLRHESDCIRLDADTAPRKETSATRNQSRTTAQPLDTLRPHVMAVLKEAGKALPAGLLVSKVREAARIGEKRAVALISMCEEAGEIVSTPRLSKRGGEVRRGTPEQVEKYMNPDLPSGRKA